MTAPRRLATEAPPPWRWAAAGGLLGLLLALLLFMPASWLAAGVARGTGGKLLLAEARGTVWNGSARLVLTGGAGSSDALALPGHLDWRLRPRLAGFKLELLSSCCMPRPMTVRGRWRPGSLRLDLGSAESQWPAALLAGLGTPWNTLQFDGQLRLSTQALSIEWSAGRPTLAGRAELLAQGMSSRLSTLRPMGSYRIALQGGAAPSLRLETLEGSLQLTGAGQWVGGRLRFRGEASAAPEREAALANLLNIIGRRSGARSVITIG